MDLPRELRDEVYRALFLPVRVVSEPSDRTSRYFRIHPSILRVSQQTYRESSRVLYKETKWVSVTSFDDQEDDIVRSFKRFGFSFPSVQSSLCFPGMPVLRIEMTNSSTANFKCQTSVLVAQPLLQYISITFIACRCVRIALWFDKNAMQDPLTREALVHFCSNIRGLTSVTVEGLDPMYCARLTDSMRTPIRRFGEHFERLEAYQQLARHQLAQGRFLDAFETNCGGSFSARFAGPWKPKGGLLCSKSQAIQLKGWAIDFSHRRRLLPIKGWSVHES